MVLIKENVTPRMNWKMGKVESLIIGRDNLIRGATLKTYQKKTNKTCIIRRPLQYLIPLEVDNVEDEC